MRVEVYWNFHRKLFSVRALEGPRKGRVIDHAEHIALRDVEFKVSAAGRARVLRERRKNVHATVRGVRVPGNMRRATGFSVRYNPYHAGRFLVPWCEAHYSDGTIGPVERSIESADFVQCRAVDGAARMIARGVHFGDMEVYG